MDVVSGTLYERDGKDTARKFYARVSKVPYSDYDTNHGRASEEPGQIEIVTRAPYHTTSSTPVQHVQCIPEHNLVPLASESWDIGSWADKSYGTSQ